MSPLPLLVPDWPAPPQVRALQTLRRADLGAAPTRAQVIAGLVLPAAPGWLTQVHGTAVARLPASGEPQADAAWTNRRGVVCAVQTADCLPVLLCDEAGERVAVAHAGWRGLCAGVVEQTVAALGIPGSRLLAWLGAAIGPQAFEVGDEVRAAFVAADPAAAAAFAPAAPGKHTADLYALARQRLARVGVQRVWGGGLCTWSDPQRFYSYRRGARTGRMASLIWLDSGRR